MVVFLVAAVLALALPAASLLRESGRSGAGARLMAGQLAAMRWRSVTLRKGHGLLFERDDEGWLWRIVEDGNGNGLRTAEVKRGVDPLLSGPHRLERSVEHVRLGFPPGGPFPRIPPKRGVITDTEDPIQFGRSNLVGFSPLGDASSGTLYVTDGREGLHGIVLFGPTARLRIWRYDPRSRTWSL